MTIVRTLPTLLVALAALVLAPPASAQAVGVAAEADAGVALATPPALPDTPSPLAEAGLPVDALPLERVARLDATGEARVDPLAHGSPRASADGAADTGEGALARAVIDTAAEVAPPAVATAGLLALVHSLGLTRALGVGAFALYSRLTRSDLLDNAHRDHVYKLIQEQPGLGVTEIAQRMGLGWGTTVYHLDRLERMGFVASERGGLHRCYFPVGTLPKGSRKGIGALKADTARSIATFLIQKPGASQSDVCGALGLSASAASKQITKLESAGLVRRERAWKTVRLHPEPPLHALLAGAEAPGAPRAGPAPVAA